MWVDPWRRMRRIMRRMFSQPFWFEWEIPEFGEFAPELQEFRTPLADVRDLGDKLAIDIELPGVEKGDIELRLTERALDISAKKKSGKEVEKEGIYLSERSFSKFRRSMQLPVEVVPEKAEAEFNQGILHIEVPKASSEKSGRIIQIK